MSRKEFVVVARATLEAFNKDDVSYLAAALTYYIFLSIFPLLLLSISVVGLFVSHETATEFVFQQVAKWAPGSTNVLENTIANAYAARDSAGIVALIGLGTLAFSASNAFTALDKAVNRAWGSEKVPSFIMTKLTGFAMMLVIALLLIASVIVSVALTTARAVTTKVTGDVPGIDVLFQIANLVLSLGVIFIAFLLLYRFMPRCPVSLRDVWLGALLAAILWTLLKEIFGFYLGSTFANFNATYGTLGALFALITWIYLSSLIILTGVEFAAETANMRRLRHARQEAERPRLKSPWLPFANT